MKVAIYASVSTANNGQHPTLQTRELQEYGERRGWTVAGEYVDVGISGTKETRPKLDRLMVDARRHRFDAVGWERIAAQMGVGVGTIDRSSRSATPLLCGSKTQQKVF